jgi:beta-phosphoglucomutase
MIDLPLRPRHVLFDLDGTLIDSSVLHARAFTAVLAANAPELLPRFDYERVRGWPTRRVFLDLGITDAAALTKATELKQLNYRAAVAAGHLYPMTGALELVHWLRGAGCGTHLVTGSSRGSVEAALASAGLAGLFDQMVTANDVPEGKPAPDGYLACLRQIADKAADCLAVEDAPSGILAARAAGIVTVGVFNPAVRTLADLWFPNLEALHGAFECTLAGVTAS